MAEFSDDGAGCLGAEEGGLAAYFAKAAQARIPLAVSLELTRRCSFRCVHCYLGDQHSVRRHQQREMNTATIFRLLDEMAAAGTLLLTISGGDPMLRPDFTNVYRHAVRRGFMVTVFCNGSLITDEIVSAFREHPPRAVEVTLYGASKETFEAVTQQPGSFAACLAGIERLRKAKVRLRLKTMVMSLNWRDLPALWKMAEEMGAQFRHDCSIIPALPNDDNAGRSNAGKHLHDTLRFRLAPDQAAEADLRIANVKERLRKLAQTAVPAEPTGRLHRCGAGRFSCHVTSYGTMLPCLIAMQPTFDLRQGFQQGWDSISRQFTEAQARPGFQCSTCGDRMLCTGCPVNFFLETGELKHPASFYCQYAARRRAGCAL